MWSFDAFPHSKLHGVFPTRLSKYLWHVRYGVNKFCVYVKQSNEVDTSKCTEVSEGCCQLGQVVFFRDNGKLFFFARVRNQLIAAFLENSISLIWTSFSPCHFYSKTNDKKCKFVSIQFAHSFACFPNNFYFALLFACPSFFILACSLRLFEFIFSVAGEFGKDSDAQIG